MGRSIEPAKERRIKRLLGKGTLSFRQIAELVGCAKGTVWRVKHGRRVKRPKPQPLSFQEVAPYLCVDCSERAGRDVMVSLRPCVACTARGMTSENGAS